MSDQSDPIPAEERPHRVSAETGLDPDPDTTGVDPRNLPQGAGRPDDEAHAARVAESQAATAEAAGAVAGPAAVPYTDDEVPETAADVVAWLRDADGDDDRAERGAAASRVEYNRDGGPRSTVTDELNR